jgi:hypothetical protein
MKRLEGPSTFFSLVTSSAILMEVFLFYFSSYLHSMTLQLRKNPIKEGSIKQAIRTSPIKEENYPLLRYSFTLISLSSPSLSLSDTHKKEIRRGEDREGRGRHFPSI